MKLEAIARDYDGTISINDVFDPSVRAAVGDVRRQGIYVILVTGRRVPDSIRVAGNLSWVRGRTILIVGPPGSDAVPD